MATIVASRRCQRLERFGHHWVQRGCNRVTARARFSTNALRHSRRRNALDKDTFPAAETIGQVESTGTKTGRSWLTPGVLGIGLAQLPGLGDGRGGPPDAAGLRPRFGSWAAAIETAAKQRSAMLTVSVQEYDIADVRPVFGKEAE
jgi:hypothetical protein